jgi:hypothetical protein
MRINNYRTDGILVLLKGHRQAESIRENAID